MFGSFGGRVRVLDCASPLAFWHGRCGVGIWERSTASCAHSFVSSGYNLNRLPVQFDERIGLQQLNDGRQMRLK